MDARLRDFENRLEVLGGVAGINERIDTLAQMMYAAKEVLTLEEARLSRTLQKPVV